jgi:outer membrane lipoprotein-sorting protein
MSTKLLSALLFSAVLFVSGAAFADPPIDRCEGTFRNPQNSPGDVNQVIKDGFGTPGQQTSEPSSDFAHERNDARKADCPPPGQAKKP